MSGEGVLGVGNYLSDLLFRALVIKLTTVDMVS